MKTQEEVRQIILTEVLNAWAQFCQTNVGSTDSRVGDALAAAVNRATARVFEGDKDDDPASI